jgi:hypothetical protein
MDMTIIKDNRARGKGSRGPYKTNNPDSPIPEYIKLPDGRKIPLKDIVKKQTGTKNHNLLTEHLKSNPPPKLTAGRKQKYTDADRVWQSTATAQEIADKYGMTVRVARSIKTYARYLTKHLQTESGYIIDHTKK